MSMRQQRLAKQRMTISSGRVQWGVRNLVHFQELFHHTLFHPSHIGQKYVPRILAVMHTCHLLDERYLKSVQGEYVHLVSSTYVLLLSAHTPMHIDNNYNWWLWREGYKRCYLQNSLKAGEEANKLIIVSLAGSTGIHSNCWMELFRLLMNIYHTCFQQWKAVSLAAVFFKLSTH